MYEHQGLQDILFLMLYGGATMLAFVACCLLLLSHGTFLSSETPPPASLRRWAAAFMASVAASHVWWVILGIYCLADDRLVRNITAIALDRLTFVPLMMCVLLRMLQDRRRPLWPVAVVIAPIAVIAIVSIVIRFDAFEWVTEIYSILIGIVFVGYYVYALRQYGRWLRENYADLERKELWQSLLLLAFILFIYIAYSSNEGGLAAEYFAQVNTLIIIVFIFWRVVTLQELNTDESAPMMESLETADVKCADTTELRERNSVNSPSKVALANIGPLLQQHCEEKQLYLQHDLTLAQLAIAIGTNRTYLGAYFVQKGITYNAYINSLRIDHFVMLYEEAVASSRPVTAYDLAWQCGYSSYSTFSAAFKNYKGLSVAAWMKQIACQ